jgi:hypothetical protein
VKRLTRHLLDRSQQAFALALEIFNKPTIAYRIEGFCFFYVNAWELMTKARLVDTSGKERSIYYRKRGVSLVVPSHFVTLSRARSPMKTILCAGT